ncbi:MAG: ABC transporter ATP-binding protein [Rhodothermaceae bacterium]
MFKTLKMITDNNNIKIFRVALISVLEALFGSIPFAVLYFVLCDIMDNAFTTDKLLNYSGMIIASAVFRIFFSFLNITFARKEGTLMIKDLRLRLGEHIRKLSLGFFNTHNTGELSNKTLENVNKLEMIVTMLLPEMVSTFVLSLLVGFGLFFIDYRMAIATIITMPLAFGILVWARNIMAKQGKALYLSSEQLADSLLEFVNGIKFIKSFNTSQKKFNDLVENMNDFRIKSLKTEGTLSPVMVFAGISIDFGLVMLILAGSYYISGGILTGKTFLIFIIISSRFFENLKTLSVNYVKVKYFSIAGQKVQEIFNENLLSGTGNTTQFEDHNIEFKNISFSYNEKKVLNNINLKIKEKSLTAFVGPSGSGKTTMTNLIARFFDTDSGNIKLGGRNIKNIDSEKVLKEISMVFQNVVLFRDTIFNNIKIGKPDASESEIIEAAKKANCHDFILKLPNGYNTMVGENGANLSGGEQQRISIARAMLKNAPVILLDEATASLDPENEIFIQNAISKLLENKTVIVIAHRLKTIKNADKIVVLENGKIKEEGKHEELLGNKSLYHQMWQTQQNAVGWKISNCAV